MPRLDRILSHYDFDAIVALDSAELIATRVQNLLAADRRMTLCRRWVDRDTAPTVVAGLTVDETRRWKKDSAVGIGVHLGPGINGFSVAAYAGIDPDTEADGWRRYHSGEKRTDLTEVRISGGLPNSGPNRDDQIRIRRWNQNGVCEEIIVAFDLGPVGRRDRAATHLYDEHRGATDQDGWLWSQPDEVLDEWLAKADKLLAAIDHKEL